MTKQTPEPQGQAALVRLRALIEEVWTSHRDRYDGHYNQCEEDECAWCQETREALDAMSASLERRAAQGEPPSHDDPASRLRWFVRKHALGGCKVLSDPDCTCPLCDVDRLTGAAPQAPLEAQGQAALVREKLTEARRAAVLVKAPGGFQVIADAVVRRLDEALDALKEPTK